MSQHSIELKYSMLFIAVVNAIDKILEREKGQCCVIKPCNVVRELGRDEHKLIELVRVAMILEDLADMGAIMRYRYRRGRGRYYIVFKNTFSAFKKSIEVRE